MNRRNLVAIGLLVLLIAIVVASRGPGTEAGDRFDPRGTSPRGARGLVLLLEEFDADVRLDVQLDLEGVDSALVLDDRMSEDARVAIDQWVRSGGRLVVGDPDSPFWSTVAFPSAASNLIVDRCTTPGLEAVEELAVARFSVVDADGASSTCVLVDGEVIAAERRLGEGTVVEFGVRDALVNGRLDQADNAVLAVGLLAAEPDVTIAFVDRVTVLDAEGLWDLVADRIWIALAVASVAFLVFSIAVGRRLGKPVPEPRQVPIEGSELIDATGRLLDRNQVPAAAADRIRRRFRVETAPLVGVDVAASDRDLAAAIARYSGEDPAGIVALLERPVDDDDGLVAVAAGIQELAAQVRQDEHPTHEEAS